MSGNLARTMGFAVLPAYLLITLVIGAISRRNQSTANDFLNASRSLPLWVVSCAFFSVNSGALEIVGLSAFAAQYGVQAFHFYWIGAIPGMIFFGGIMVPLYMRSGARSLPEYLEKRFDRRVRLINACILLITGTALSGIGLYAVAQVLNAVFRWPFTACALLVGSVVLAYVLLGGLRATIYNEVFRILVFVAGLAPLLWLSTTSLRPAPLNASSHWHLWTGLPAVAPSATLDRVGVIGGLGMVLSFSYWCTDFVLVQRALSVRTVAEGRLVPLFAGFAKLGFSFLVICPALGAAAFLGQQKPASFDQTLPVLMAAFYHPAMLGLGLTVLVASLMSALASNVSAFSALWTEEIYRRNVRISAQERHYIKVAKSSVPAAIALSIGMSYTAFLFQNLMEYVQLLFSLFSAPFFAVILLGLFTRRATARGALAGLAAGIAVALAHFAFIVMGRLHYGSTMSANFYIAISAFITSLAFCIAFSIPADRRTETELAGLTFQPTGANAIARPSRLWWALAFTLLASCAVLNFWWR